jgi:hypothetical protein
VGTEGFMDSAMCDFSQENRLMATKKEKHDSKCNSLTLVKCFLCASFGSKYFLSAHFMLKAGLRNRNSYYSYRKGVIEKCANANSCSL